MGAILKIMYVKRNFYEQDMSSGKRCLTRKKSVHEERYHNKSLGLTRVAKAVKSKNRRCQQRNYAGVLDAKRPRSFSCLPVTCYKTRGGEGRTLFPDINSSLDPVNMAVTDVTRMSSDYADNELELFVKTMDLIVSSENGKASSTDILNSADSMTCKKLKKSETEHLLTRLVQDKWLNEKRGEYTLSTRCIIEMEPYIRSMYQDQVKVCHICHNIAIQSQICENPVCGIKIHNPCVARYFQGKPEPRCPACNDFWPHEIPEVRQLRSKSRR